VPDPKPAAPAPAPAPAPALAPAPAPAPAPATSTYKIQAHRMTVTGCFEYSALGGILDIQVGGGGFNLGIQGEQSQQSGIMYYGAGEGTIRITSHYQVNFDSQVQAVGSCSSTSARRLQQRQQQRRERRERRLRQDGGGDGGGGGGGGLRELSAKTYLAVRALQNVRVSSTIAVDVTTLLTMASLQIASTGSIEKPVGRAGTQCLQGVQLREKCKSVLLEKWVNSLNLDQQPWPKTNFTVMMGVTGTGKLSLNPGSPPATVQGDRVLVCSDNGTVAIDGNLDTKGYGCQGGFNGKSGQGASPFPGGGGLCQDSTYGGGGAHFGNGGQGCAKTSDDAETGDQPRSVRAHAVQKQKCRGPSRHPVFGGQAQTHGIASEPLLSGAGGGCPATQSSNNNGNGGGVVVVHTRQFSLGTGQSLCDSSSCKQADYPAYVRADGSEGSSGDGLAGGGGGGGSISIEADVIASSPSSSVSVVGGDGATGTDGLPVIAEALPAPAGGGGSGGRLFIQVPRDHTRVATSAAPPTPGPESTKRKKVAKAAASDWTSEFLGNISAWGGTGGHGDYVNSTGATGQLHASACPQNMELQPLNHKQEQLSCELCPAGKFFNGQGECQFCASGTFQACTGKPSCIACGNNTYCDHDGCSACNNCGKCMCVCVRARACVT
jgi:hypothetical protein